MNAHIGGALEGVQGQGLEVVTREQLRSVLEMAEREAGGHAGLTAVADEVPAGDRVVAI